MRINRRYRRRRSWRGLVTTLAAIVVFCTTYALILPAITMEKTPNCGVEEHVHGDGCYSAPVSLSCSTTERYIHTHDTSCYLESGELLCGLREIQAHSHSDECHTVESTVHEHGTGCYTPEKDGLTCNREETAGHAHGTECYEEQALLTCVIPEGEDHSHGEDCHGTESVLICLQEETPGHAHADECYVWTDVLTCETSTEETILSEPVLSCGLTEIVPHTHGDGCYGEDGSLTCTQPQIEEHIHCEACLTAGEEALICTLEEHTHDEVLCYIDSEADLETEEQWKATLPKNLSGIWADDLLAVAQSQLGYTESQYNVQVDAEGNIRGYTRYGAWYGEPYSDWNAIFVSFCLNYAEIDRESFSYESNAERWITVLSAREQYAVAAEYTPIPGDLVFLDLDDNGYADTAAIVKSLDANHLTVIQGDTENRSVEQIAYLLSDTPVETEEKVLLPGDILGYGILPENPNPDGAEETTEATEVTEARTVYDCGLEEHTHEDACYDAEGNVVCELEEHVHTEECEVLPEDGYFCGDEEHGHTILCTANLTGLSEEDKAAVERVILLIDAMPSADEIDAKIAEFEEAEDYEGEEAWLTEVYQQIADVYIAYSELGELLRACVVNADKLMDVEYIWSEQALIEDINSAAPTPTWYTSTKDFIELNLYDYIYGINTNWESNKKYPGFQWNGGAYSKYRYSYADADDGIPNAITDRYFIDGIDFGNSIITNYQYMTPGEGAYYKSGTSIGVGYLYNNSNAPNTGKINWLWYDGSNGATTTNRPVGISTGYQSISRNLGDDGYPALTDGTSLAYLFGGTSASYVIKKNTESIDGLFQQDSVSGEYQYNSRTNHAQYTNNFFQLYEEIITPNFITYPFGNFLPLNTISDLTQATQVGAFNYDGGMKTYVEGIISDLNEALDRDDDGNGTVADYGDTSRSQLKVMLQEYRENWNWYPSNKYGTNLTWANLSPAMAIRDYFNGTDGGDTPSSDVGFVTQAHLDNMYNIDWDVATNFFFGMEMKMTFMQPKNGYTGNDTNGDGASDYPMVFYFTGDDDVWVYIDDVLFLDLTGIHRHVGGEIDFVNGKVHYYELDVENGGDVSSTPYATYTFKQILDAAGASTAGLNGNGTFTDYSTHTFNFYYVERGSGSSVCRLNFNFPMLKKNSISVNKENLIINGTSGVSGTVEGNPDYYFNIVNSSNQLFVGPGSVTGISEYKIMDSAGNILKNDDGTDKVFTTDQYGIFTLKAGQTAVFEGIEENEGSFFVQELIKAEDNAQYPNVNINDEPSRYNALIDWSYRTYFSDGDDDKYTGPYGFKWYGRSGQDTDSSTNSSFYFEQQNHVDVSKLGSLSLTKEVQRYVAPMTDTYYRMYITLDDQPLKEGLTVTVTGADGATTRTATVGREVVNGQTVSYIDIAEGETALIPNIISGTRFRIWESAASSEGYNVDYSADNADEVTDTGEYISGVIRVDTEVAVTITNAERGTQLEIPAVKSFRKFVEGTYEYTFTLTETDENGAALENGITLSETVQVTADNTEFKFDPITYLAPEFDALPAARYYRIEETGGSNTQAFLVEVTISQDASDPDAITAAVTRVSEQNGTEWTEVTDKTVNFVNTLTGDLTLSKTVKGVDAGQEFGFIIQFEPGTSGVSELPASYPVTIHHKDGTSEPATIPFSDNDTHLTLAHGEGITIHGIPIGVKWTIIEGTPVYDENGNFVTVEEKSPDGYIVSWKADSGTVTEDNTSTGSIVIDGTDVQYINNSTYELPETGGAGTQMYTMGGLLLMLTAGILLMYSHRRRGKEDY